VLVISNCRNNGLYRALIFAVLASFICGCSGYQAGRLPVDSLGEPGPQAEGKEIKVGDKVKLRLVSGGGYKGQVLNCSSEGLSIRFSGSGVDTRIFSVRDIEELQVEYSGSKDAMVAALFFGIPVVLVLVASHYAPAIGE